MAYNFHSAMNTLHATDPTGSQATQKDPIGTALALVFTFGYCLLTVHALLYFAEHSYQAWVPSKPMIPIVLMILFPSAPFFVLSHPPRHRFRWAQVFLIPPMILYLGWFPIIVNLGAIACGIAFAVAWALLLAPGTGSSRRLNFRQAILALLITALWLGALAAIIYIQLYWR